MSQRSIERRKKTCCSISVPYIHLIDQWLSEIEKFGIHCATLIANSDKPDWKYRLTDELFDIKNGIINKLLVLTTHVTLSSDSFTEIIKTAVGKLFLIGDEVHSTGAPKRKAGLIEEYDFRLGLSATPKRWFDPGRDRPRGRRFFVGERSQMML